MNLPEQKIEQRISFPDSQKEKENSPIFVVRFGVGPHVVENSDWHIDLRRDLDSFFEPHDPSQRNIFYLEDALGSQSFVEHMGRAYKVYKSWLKAYFWSDLKPVWKKLDLVGQERFPPSDKLDEIIDFKLKSLSGTNAANYIFLKTVLASMDEIIEKKHIKIDLQTETRRDAGERTSAQNTVRLLTALLFTSSNEMREWIIRIWRLRKLRDSKITEDLMDIYRKAHKKNVLTKVYVCLGVGHESCKDLLAERLGKKPSYDISLIKGSFHPSYEFDESSEAARFSVIADKAFALLDSGEKISDDDWQKMYEQTLSPKKE